MTSPIITPLRKPQRGTKHSGFTIIELLIASAVFSVVLVVVLASFVQISRIYYKGVNMANTQNATRTIVQDIQDDIQFGSNHPELIDDTYGNTGSSHQDSFCVGDHRYAYVLGTQVTAGAGLQGVYREDMPAGCKTLTQQGVTPSSAQQLLSNGMQLNHIKVDCQNGNGTVCLVRLYVVFYGGSPNGLFFSGTGGFGSNPWQAPDAQCTGALTSSQFCVTADFDRTVLQTI